MCSMLDICVSLILSLCAGSYSPIVNFYSDNFVHSIHQMNHRFPTLLDQNDTIPSQLQQQSAMALIVDPVSDEVESC